MNIPISDYNYHIGKLDEKEKNFVKKTLNSLFNVYPDLKRNIHNQISKTKLTFSNELLENIATGFIYFLRDNNYQESQFLKKLKTYFNLYLPIILENLNCYITNHFVMYEPKVAISFYLANYVLTNIVNEVDKEIQKQGEDSFDAILALDVIALFRAIKSSIVLFSLGDDVHGVGLYRGIQELVVNIKLAKSYKEDYVKYKIYNRYLQLHKLSGDPLPEDMVKDLGTKKTNENFIKYGWVKKPNGKRVDNLTDFLKLSNKNPKEVETFIHYSSEFIHEDYNGVGYDYIWLRRTYLDIYFNIAIACLDLISDNKHLFNKINGLLKDLE